MSVGGDPRSALLTIVHAAAGAVTAVVTAPLVLEGRLLELPPTSWESCSVTASRLGTGSGVPDGCPPRGP